MSRPRHQLLPPGVPPLVYRQGAMAAALSLSESKFKAMIEEGLLPRPRLLDGQRLYILDDYRAALFELPVEPEPAAGEEEQDAETKWQITS